MHRIWRAVLLGVVCVALAWPTLGLAYIRPADIVEADPISDDPDNAMTGAPSDEEATPESSSYWLIGWLPSTLSVQLPWGQQAFTTILILK